MLSIKTIKRRIKTAKNIGQITRAMQLVAASRMQKAQGKALASRPYAEKLSDVFGNLSKTTVIPNGNKDKVILILIAPDRGLCGGLVTALGRKLWEFLEENGDKTREFIVVGKKARELAFRAGGNIVAEFLMGSGAPKYEMVPPIVNLLSANNFPKTTLIYPRFINTMVQEPVTRQLLPAVGEMEPQVKPLGSTQRPVGANIPHHPATGGIGAGTETVQGDKYLFEPTAETVFGEIFPHYLEMEIYQVILEAYASEQSARMIAMKNASDNAQDITKELVLTYNKVRQQAITNEIADIATAAVMI
ncbi:MAG: ATP synthase F1 subunit gamma [bacterium]|nr:ATP synthase F1 subunit gamma [bacterium]